MLAPPPDVPDLVEVLAREWGLTVGPLEYVPVGYGSHHWAAGTEWFVNLDEPAEPESLTAALAAARTLRDGGNEFVLAPVPTLAGEPLVTVGRFAVSVYPFVAGESFSYGEFPTDAHRRAVLDLLAAVHTSGVTAAPDDLAIECREALTTGFGDHGPYSPAAARLVAEHEAVIHDRLARFDALAAAVDRDRAVLTHGEPHPGNTMRVAGGWLLIDWETARRAPPERDLWLLCDLDEYRAATGIEPVPELLELYALRWQLSDLAYELSRFQAPHGAGRAEETSWRIVREVLAGLRRRTR